MVNLRMTSRSMQTEPVQVSHLTYLCSLNHSLICHSGFSCRKLILSTHTPFDMLCGHASSCGAPSVLRGTHPPAGHTSSSGPHIPLWGTQYPAGHTSFCGAHILLHGTHPPVRHTPSCGAHSLLRFCPSRHPCFPGIYMIECNLMKFYCRSAQSVVILLLD